MLQRQRIRYIIARSFMVVFTLMLLNGIVFRHAHKLSSGKVVTHAHPYKTTNPSSPYQPNDHTTNELFLLDMCSNVPFIGLTLTVILTDVRQLLLSFPQFRFSYLSAAYHAPFFSKSSPRGPPIH